mgnify:CR=1 FL=1
MMSLRSRCRRVKPILVELSNDMKNRIRGFLAENLEKEPEVLAEERYARFRQF